MVMTDAVDGPYGSVLVPGIQAKWSDVVLARREAKVARVSNSQEHSPQREQAVLRCNHYSGS